jgi:hypothetical protein
MGQAYQQNIWNEAPQLKDEKSPGFSMRRDMSSGLAWNVFYIIGVAGNSQA